ncbi:MAG: hypothetical protein DRQ43_11665 [Gammaproteobacteria bacterium]|nr:MAG: hypothetical protein DRQ43_11665 [Gammaproteobacteria bacterium]
MKPYLFLLLLLCAACNPVTSYEGGSEKMNFEINYNDSMFEMSVTIGASGSALLTIGNNRTDPDFDTLGLFRASISEQYLEQLVTAMRSLEFQNIVNPKFAVSGEPVRQLSMEEEERQIMKWTAYSTPTPPEFIAMEERILGVVHSLRRHPVLAISVSSPDFPEQLERDKPGQFSVSISNPGTDTIKLQHPENWSDEVTNLRLMALRSDIPLELLDAYHQKSEELTAESIVDIKGAQIEKNYVTLSPGEKVLYTISFTPDWPPGKYNVEIFYAASLFDGEEKEQLDCTFLTHSFALIINGEEKPGDVPDDENNDEEL